MNDIQNFYEQNLTREVPTGEFLREAALDIMKELSVFLGSIGFGVVVVGMTGEMLATALKTNFPENPRVRKFLESASHVQELGSKIAVMGVITALARALASYVFIQMIINDIAWPKVSLGTFGLE